MDSGFKVARILRWDYTPPEYEDGILSASATMDLQLRHTVGAFGDYSDFCTLDPFSVPWPIWDVARFVGFWTSGDRAAVVEHWRVTVKHFVLYRDLNVELYISDDHEDEDEMDW